MSDSTIDPSLVPVSQIFKVSTGLFRRSLKGLQTEELFRSPGEANPIIWLAGHLTDSRCGLLNLLRVKQERPWQKLFGRFSKLSEQSDYPGIDQIQTTWQQAHETLQSRLSALTREELTADSPYDFPIEDKSIYGAIHFLAWHESYHVGQMAYVRKWLGHGGLIDG